MSVAALPHLWTIAELAEAAQVSRRTIEREIAARRLRVVRPSPRSVRITDAEARGYLSSARLGGTDSHNPGGSTGV